MGGQVRSLLLALPLILGIGSETGAANLAFEIAVKRAAGVASDTVLVVTTARNVGDADLHIWGAFDFHGGYKPSAESAQDYATGVDSARAAKGLLGQYQGRDEGPRLPVYALVSPYDVKPRKPLTEISLPASAAFCDTLKLILYRPEFASWPGYIVLAGQFLLGNGPEDYDTAVRLGERDLRIAIPVP